MNIVYAIYRILQFPFLLIIEFLRWLFTLITGKAPGLQPLANLFARLQNSNNQLMVDNTDIDALRGRFFRFNGEVREDSLIDVVDRNSNDVVLQLRVLSMADDQARVRHVNRQHSHENSHAHGTNQQSSDQLIDDFSELTRLDPGNNNFRLKLKTEIVRPDSPVRLGYFLVMTIIDRSFLIIFRRRKTFSFGIIPFHDNDFDSRNVYASHGTGGTGGSGRILV